MLFAYYYLPSTCSNSKRPSYIANKLAEEGHSVKVVTSNRLVLGNASENLSMQNITVERVSDPLEKVRNMKSRTVRTLYRVVNNLLWPDNVLFWVLKVSKYYRIEHHDYDRIIVETTPISSLLIPLLLRRMPSTILDYQDLYSYSAPFKSAKPLYRIGMPFLMSLQRYIFRKVKGVVFAAKSYKDNYTLYNTINRNTAAYCIPFFYDDNHFNEDKTRNDKCIICYTGQFGGRKGQRSPEVFFKSMRQFLYNRSAAANQIEFRYYGRWNKRHNVYINKYNLSSIININESVSYNDYIKIIKSATILLLMVSSADKLFVPSKLLDYIGANVPILGYVPKGSETHRILKKLNIDNYIVEENDYMNGADKLDILWNKWNNGDIYNYISPRNHYTARTEMPKFVRILNSESTNLRI